MVTRPVIITGAKITRAVKTQARVRGASDPSLSNLAADRRLGFVPEITPDEFKSPRDGLLVATQEKTLCFRKRTALQY